RDAALDGGGATAARHDLQRQVRSGFPGALRTLAGTDAVLVDQIICAAARGVACLARASPAAGRTLDRQSRTCPVARTAGGVPTRRALTREHSEPVDPVAQ